MNAAAGWAVLAALGAAVGMCSASCAAPRSQSESARPTPAQSPGVADDPHAFRSQIPRVSTSARPPLPEPAAFTLSNGIRVVVREDHRMPLFAAALMFAGGAQPDPVGKEGLAAVCMAAWLPENETVGGERLGDMLADLGVGVAASHGDTYSLITMRGPAWNHLEALRLLQYVALPNDWVSGMRRHALDRAKQRIKLAARAASMDVERQAAGLLRVALLGDLATDARVPTNASIDAISFYDCADYQRRYLTADQLTIIVAGDIDADMLSMELERDRHVRDTAFIHLPKTTSAKLRTVAATLPPTAKPHTATRITATLSVVLHHVPEAAQTQVVVGYLGPPPTEASYLPMLVAMQALGGAGAGRLVTNLREEKGFGYYAKYSATTTRDNTVFGLHASVEPGAAWITAIEMLRERRDIATNTPVMAAELATIVVNRTQLVYEAFAKPQQWIMSYVQAARLGLPNSYVSQQVTELGLLSPNEIYATMQTALTLPVIIVIVGDANAPQYAPALIPGWNPRVPRMRDGAPVTLRQAFGDMMPPN